MNSMICLLFSSVILRLCSVVRLSSPFCSMILDASAGSLVPNAFCSFSADGFVPLPESVYTSSDIITESWFVRLPSLYSRAASGFTSISNLSPSCE